LPEKLAVFIAFRQHRIGYHPGAVRLAKIRNIIAEHKRTVREGFNLDMGIQITVKKRIFFSPEQLPVAAVFFNRLIRPEIAVRQHRRIPQQLFGQHAAANHILCNRYLFCRIGYRAIAA